MSQCTIINAHITDQVIQLSNLPRIASGSKNALQIRISCCSKWEGCGLVAVFYRKEDEAYHVPVVDGLVTVPWEVLVDEGFFWFGIMGQDDLTRTTEAIRIEVAKGALTVATATPQEPTPDIYQQVIAAYSATEVRFAERFSEVTAMQRDLESRFNAAIAVPGSTDEASFFEGTSLDGLVGVRIFSNGFIAYADISVSGGVASLLASQPSYETDFMIPPGYAPLCPATVQGDASHDYHVTLSSGTAHVAGLAQVVVYGDVPAGDFSVSVWYGLAKPSLPELTNIRVGIAGNYSTAGDAVRGQVSDVRNNLNQIVEEHLVPLEGQVEDVRNNLNQTVEEHLMPLEETVGNVVDQVNSMDADVADHEARIEALEKGGPLDVHEVDGYAFAVSDEEGNVAFGIKPDGETVGTFTDKVARDKLAPLTTTPDYAYAVCDADGRVVFAITHSGEVKYVGAGEGGESGGGEVIAPTFDYTKCGLPVLALTGDTSAMTKDDAVTLDYTLKTPKGTVIKSGTCTCKWQGSSSVRRGYPKRNYTIKFDSEFEATAALGSQSEREVKTSPWGAQKKYCMKANWIDPSGARNVVLAKLWGAIVASRENVHEKLAASPNKGAIDGFPVIIAINGEFTGLYTFNIPKDGWMFNMGEGAAEYVVCGESNSMSACGFYAEATFIEGDSQADTDFAFEYQPDDVEEATVVESFNGAIRAVMNAPNSSDWEDAVAPYFDIDSAIDYYIFTCCIGGMDNLRKNILYGTYDGVKWFMSAYDLDTTLGSNPYGTGLYPVKTSKTQFYEAANGSGKHRLFELIYKYSLGKLKARWEELRGGILSDANVWYMFNNFVNAIPRSVYDADADKWTSWSVNQVMPATTTANVENYMQYYRMHCALLDKEMEE